MIFAILSLLFASNAVFAASLNDTIPTLQCAPYSQAQVDAAESNFRQILSTMDYTPDDTTASPPISIVWHVIQKNDDYYGGNIPDSQIQGTIDAFNGQFRNSGISFALTKITRTTNADWFSNIRSSDSSLVTDMKTQLHEGDATTLNVYTVGFESSKDLAAFITFPWEYSANPVVDGVVVRYDTLLGGTCRYYNEGKIFFHEAGHWLGLWDVFQQGCDGDGDQVNDTPPQRKPTYGCPWAKKTCTWKKGWDSIHNHMDYSYDQCRHEFTDGQLTRIKEQLLAYRGVRVG